MIHAVIAAAGRGKRFGGEQKKQFTPLAADPLLIHSLTAFQRSALIGAILCVVSKEDLSFTEELISGYTLPKVKAVLPGGARRQGSVGAAVTHLEEVGQGDDIVLVHDGARPLVTGELIEGIVQGVKDHGAAVAACRMTDSLKEVSEEGMIEKSVSRARIWAMQTPQGFRLSVLAEACRKGAADAFYATDEAMLVERLGIPIYCVEGSAENIKITTPSDLKMAEHFLHLRSTSSRQEGAGTLCS